MTEHVAVSTNGEARTAYHDVVDGKPACGLSKKSGHEFELVPREHVGTLHHCQHCSGTASARAGQGSTLAAKLAAADPEEVQAP